MSVTERQALSRDLIAATALRLTDENGLRGLSMRKLGSELGVEAMSLYHYVANKDDLLDAVLDRLYDEIELPLDTPKQDWETAVRVGFRSFYQVLMRHPAAVELFSSRPARSIGSLQVLYWSYRRFEVLGLDPVQSLSAFRFGVAYVMGHAGTELGVVGRPEGDEVDLTTIPDAEVRDFIALQQRHPRDELFEAGLDTVVAGLRSMYQLP